jgi:hypothetical protein
LPSPNSTKQLQQRSIEMKKVTILIIVALVLGMILAACGGGATAPTSEPGTTPQAQA